MKPPTEIPEQGRFAVLTDPQGANFALWQMKDKVTPTKDGDKSVTKPATPFCWEELYTNDVEGALKFYKPALSWGTVDHKMGETTYHMWTLKGEKDPKKCFGGAAEVKGGASPYWITYIEVTNADETAALVKKHGGKVVKELHDVPTVGRMGDFTDPTGALFAIIQQAPKTESDKMDTADDKKRPSRGKAKKEPEKEEKKEKKAPKEKKEKAPAKSKAKGKRKAAEVEEDDEDKDEGEGKDKPEANGEKDGEGEKKDGEGEGDKKKSKGRGKKAKTS